MHRMPDFCKTCIGQKKWNIASIDCIRKNQAKTVNAAIRLWKHKGELPCSFSPIRSEFFNTTGILIAALRDKEN